MTSKQIAEMVLAGQSLESASKDELFDARQYARCEMPFGRKSRQVEFAVEAEIRRRDAQH